MFGKAWVSMDADSCIEAVDENYKKSKRVGQYKVSPEAIYKAEHTYLSVGAITEITHDRTSVHVSGCCAGGVPVERLIFDTVGGRYPFIFDTVKDVEKILSIIGKEAS